MIDLKLIKINDWIFEVRFKTDLGKKIGTIERVDGYFYFFTTGSNFGFFSEELLESIAKELRIINKCLNESLESYFKNDQLNRRL